MSEFSYKKREIIDRSKRPYVQIDVELIAALNPLEFITYAQIMRRAGKDGQCWESLQHMAEETSMSASSLKRSIKGLFSKNLIGKEVRKGGTDLYFMTPPEDWKLGNIKTIKQSPEPSSLGTEHGSHRPTEHGSHRPTNKIPFKLDPINQDQDAHEQVLNHPQSPTLAAGDPSSEEQEKETILNGLELSTHLPVHSVFEFSENGKGSAACRTTADNTNTVTKKEPWGDRYNSQKANRAKAKANSNYELGLKNKRWNDLQDFKKFESYASDWVKTHPEIVLGGKSELTNPTGYLIALMGKIARCGDEGDQCLTVWKNWQLEKQVFSPEFVTPEMAVVISAAEESKARIQESMKKFQAQRAANQAAREAEEREYQEKRWLSA